MFDGLLGRGFTPKGKLLIKQTKNRIDVLRRKRTATIKFLKKDLAELVSNGLDVNAYSRAGGLLDELRHLWNLDFVENTCDFLYKNLSKMQKMAECPEDCREAVSSLMFAASGFSELPELRELRQMFHQKYTDLLGLFVNQELVENMSSKPFSLEKKVKLMEDVALEFSIRWDSKAFEKKISRHNSTSVKETPRSTYDKYKLVDRALPRREEFDLSSKESFESYDNGFSLNGLRGNQHELTSKERSENVYHASRSENKDNKAERKEFYMKPKQESSRARNEPIFNEGDTIVMKIKRENQHLTTKERSENVHHTSRLEIKDNKAEKKEFYLQSKQESYRERHEPIFNEGDTIVMKVKGENHEPGKKTEIITTEKPNTKRADKLVLGFKQENFFQGYKHENYKEYTPQKVEDKISKPPKPSSKSKRTKSLDSGSNDQEIREEAVLMGEITANPVRKVEEPETERMMKSSIYKSLPPPYVKAKKEKAEASVYPKARINGEEDEAVQSLQHIRRDQEKDDEEKMMDKLLLHYSKKPTKISNVEQETKSRRTHQPARASSLPSEKCVGLSEPTKVFGRASSFQTEREAKHVHPKLPNYDDLAARFAELKGR